MLTLGIFSYFIVFHFEDSLKIWQKYRKAMLYLPSLQPLVEVLHKVLCHSNIVDFKKVIFFKNSGKNKKYVEVIL